MTRTGKILEFGHTEKNTTQLIVLTVGQVYVHNTSSYVLH